MEVQEFLLIYKMKFSLVDFLKKIISQSVSFFNNLTEKLIKKIEIFKKNKYLKLFFQKIRTFSLQRKIYVIGYVFGKKINNLKIKRFFAYKIYLLKGIKQNVLIKYISKELFLYFLVCFAFFFVVFFVNQILLLAETILKKKVPVGSVIKLIWYCLPSIIAQSAPFATLVGFLMCLGRMVTDNEVLIMRASGQKYSFIFKPVVVMGLIISIFSFVMNDYFLPLGTINYNKLYRQIVVSNPAIELESNSVKRMEDSIIVIGTVEDDTVSDLVFFDSSESGKTKVIVSQDTQILKSVSPGVIMQLNMDEPSMLSVEKSKKSSWDFLKADSLSLNVFENAIISSSSVVSPREMTSYDLGKKIKSMKELKQFSKKQLNSYNLEYNKKFSVPFGSIFFAILAFPLALVFGKKDGITLGLIFGIIISVLYWAATILGQLFGIRSGYNGFWMMWGPNFFLGLLGILLYMRLRKK